MKVLTIYEPESQNQLRDRVVLSLVKCDIDDKDVYLDTANNVGACN